jgi:hypothetical protein
MSFSVAGRAVPPHVTPMMAQPGVVPPVAPQSSPLIQQYDGAPPVFPQVIVPPTAALPPWAGDEDGFDYGIAPNAKVQFADYMPSLTHSQVIPPPSLPFVSSPVGQWASSSPTMCISLQKTLLSAIRAAVCKSSIRGTSHARGLIVADTGGTNHMLPDASAFISYKRVTDLSIYMGNNSFAPVLGRGTAVFSLNGKRVLIRNTLHVPGLAVQLYSLRAHLHQHGCGFIGTFEDGFHVYFPSFILSVYMSSDCHPTYESLGMSAPLPMLRYVQPQCAANLYLSEMLASSSAATPHPVLIKDEDAVSVADVS